MTQIFIPLLSIALSLVAFALTNASGFGREAWTTPVRILCSVANMFLGVSLVFGTLLVVESVPAMLPVWLLVGWAFGLVTSAISQLVRPQDSGALVSGKSSH